MSRQPTGRGPLVAERRYPKSSRSAQPSKARTRASGGSGGGGGRGRRPSPPRRKPPRGPLGWLGRIVRRVLGLILRATVTAVAMATLAVLGASWYIKTSLPEVSELLDGRASGSVTLLDREGQVFAHRGALYGGAVTAETVSPNLRNALVATEDRRFYHHMGLSPRGIASAVRINLREGRGPLSGHGGSTITQQTAKLLCLGNAYNPDEWKNEAEYVADCRRGSIDRKLREALYAIAMEMKYSKDEILSIYLNRAYMGGGAYGAAAASAQYFGKSAAELTPSEAAMLAGLQTAPSRLSPTSNLARSQARAATVLRLMEDEGYLTAEERAYWTDRPATLAKDAKADVSGYFADWVMQSGPEYFTRNTTEDVVIETTLDPRIQAATSAAVDRIFSEKVREGSEAQVAVVVMSADGAVRAMVGGRDTSASGEFNRATQAVRQTGSAFKPFIYATALELGYDPLDTIRDEPFCMTIPGSGQWCPSNYSNKFEGTVTLTHALARSLNIPAIKVSESVGRDLVMKVAHDFGIERGLVDAPSLALGVSETTLLELTGAYAGILNGGSSVSPYGLRSLRLRGDTDDLMGAGGGIGERVIQQDAAEKLVWMMSQVIESGTGQRARLEGRQVAGKTGTTQEARDAWFVGFTADYVAGVWMGYDNNTPLTGVTGSGLPAEIWHEAMAAIEADLPVRPLPMQAPERREQVIATPTPEPERQERDGLIRSILRDLLGGG